ncbi:MAG TPA: hypothetical protein P5567_12320 [Kiritimatiellia bacterium]|nr:hypothetical protein [Kiritimatiellia bacterium]HRZ13226.1 hypothetical protein [Kiritimatiellia bacterium]HSA18675.1 hypothetical protein [Kiritimatiellia bacterium]
MEDINIDCPFCGQNLDADEDLVGTNVPCPACGKIFRVVQPVRSQVNAQRIAPPPPPPAPPPNREDMIATTRIELPPEYLSPERKSRIITIKRPGH